jgi:lysophospholipase L1-like esterase
MVRIAGIYLVILLTLLLCPILRAQTSPQPFSDGDRVCFVGDSITHNGQYHSFIRLFYATRHPSQNIIFHNCGIGGDTAIGVVKRLDWDILVHKPNVIVIMLGMNDVGRSLYGKDKPDAANLRQRRQALTRHTDNMHILAERLKKAGCDTFIFLTPSIYDQTAKIPKENLFGANDALITCGKYACKLAEEFNGGVVDFNSAMLVVNAREQKKDPAATVLGPDRVHPGPAGHLLMAYLFLKAQNVSPVVSEVSIDAAAPKVLSKKNCAVKELSGTMGQVKFTLIENSLPFPIPAQTDMALEWIPSFMNDLNREILTVCNLTTGTYQLSIDDQPVGTYTSKQLTAGINLAENPQTPQYQQAMDVLKYNKDAFVLEATHLRTLALMDQYLRNQNVDLSNSDAVKKVLHGRLDRLRTHKSPDLKYFEDKTKYYLDNKSKEQQYIQQIESALVNMKAKCKPMPHHYKLIRVSK